MLRFIQTIKEYAIIIVVVVIVVIVVVIVVVSFFFCQIETGFCLEISRATKAAAGSTCFWGLNKECYWVRIVRVL